jgi:hypothetical protein
MITLAFLAMLAIAILGGARIAIWIYDENQRVNKVMRDGLAEIDNDRANDWDRDEWWR